MKKKVILTACTLALVAIGAFVTKANARRISVRYTDTATGPQCLYPRSLPADCSTENTGTICSSVSGSLTTTFYQGTSCVTPFYRL
ncbi:hypothetical protein [Chitinophaga sp. GbtcB8]|uniref:hypothetical protein n=1 Tax=Chitinophaga sp. GbtcB8 TaxID=2824753 RepID=UPI001C2F3B77|nr:hypothetical protein [Chitinophaga sp. GbtcB8]